ncbi:uncharacterized protein LOC135372332 [Ornithodoros turicata]|uniref:uncharacterized protein LOC135372332 n=1 Tax=Ornithodoros turicata TaxID=34597 RepID=UPI003139DB35
MSPFFIEKAVASLSKNVTEIKRMRSGDLLLKCVSERDSKTILNATEMMGHKISASLHKTLNTCRGVISLSELIDVPAEDILVNLKDQQVIDVRKIKIRRNNEYITTRNVILTFDTPVLPEKLKVGYLTTDVRPYIPNPLRCFKCNRFGHAAGACTGRPCCARCGQEGHETKECDRAEHCVNCSENHPSYSRSCPKWKAEKEVLHLKVTLNISYIEARKRVSPFLFGNKSYADKAKEKPRMITRATQTQVQSTKTQTDITPTVLPTTSMTPPEAVVSQLSSSSVEKISMDCDDDSSSERSFVSTSSQSQKKTVKGLSVSGSLPDISDKELAEARKKTPRQKITAPKK